MYTTIIHPLRKAFQLSTNEYILLDTIYHLSHNDKYGGWCVASKKYLAEVLDLSERWIYGAIQKLEEKEYITRDDKGFMKTTDIWNEAIANKSDWLIGFDGKESQFISAKVMNNRLNLSTPELQNLQSPCTNCTDTLQKVQSDTAKSAYNNNSNNNINIKKEKIYKKEKKGFNKEFLEKQKSLIREKGYNVK